MATETAPDFPEAEDCYAGEETVVARDVEAAADPDDPRAGMMILPAAGSNEHYVVWLYTDEKTYRYTVSRDQGGHIFDAAMRAFRQAANTRGVE